MVDFNIERYVDNELLETNFSAGKFIKTLGKNLLPGALVMLAIGGKLIESKILSVNNTPDGRLFLEMLPNKDGPGIPLKLTEPIAPNNIYMVKNPYGKDMKKLANPTFYSEENVNLFSEIEDTLLDAYVEYINMGYSNSDIVELFSLSLCDAGIDMEDGKEIISTFFSRSKTDPQYILNKNIKKYGIISDRELLPSEVGLKKYILGRIHPRAILDPDEYARANVNKPTLKNIDMITATIRDNSDIANLEAIKDLKDINEKVSKLSDHDKKVFYKAMRAK